MTGAILSDPAVTGLSKTVVTCSGTPGQCVTAPNVTQLQSGTFALPALTSGQYYEIRVTTSVTTLSGSVTNSVTVAAPGGTTDPTPGNNTASDTDTVTPIADVTTTLTAPASAYAGSTVNVPVTFSNNGPSTAAGVTYSASLPAGLSGVVCTGTGISCAYNSGSGAVTFSGLPGSLTSGQTANLTLSYTAPATGPVAVSTEIGTTTNQGSNVAPDTANGSTIILATATVDGNVYNDKNGNGTFDTGEPGINGVTVSLKDSGNNLVATTTTDGSGFYSFTNLPAGTYSVTETDPANYVSTGDTQGTSDNVVGNISVAAGETSGGNNFLDEGQNFGHLPVGGTPSYSDNLAAAGGPSHLTGSTYLGASVPLEADGTDAATFVPDPNDDNGVVPTGTWKYGTTATGNGGSANVTIACAADPCYLAAWIDWNGDGDFNDPDEQIISQAVNNGSAQSFSFNIAGGTPGNVVNGIFYLRFRLYASAPDTVSPYGAALTGGIATVGEVEDYKWTSTNGTTTPVTVAYFLAERQGNNLNFIWSTATETGNFGFNLYVKNGNKISRINDSLILSKVIDSLERVDYSYTAKANGSSFYIEDVSVLGETTRYGPFLLGKPYGARLTGEQINWASILAEHASKISNRLAEMQQSLHSSAAQAQTSAANSARHTWPTQTTVAPVIQQPTRTPQPTKTPKPTKTPRTTCTPRHYGNPGAFCDTSSDRYGGAYCDR